LNVIYNKTGGSTKRMGNLSSALEKGRKSMETKIQVPPRNLAENSKKYYFSNMFPPLPYRKNKNISLVNHSYLNQGKSIFAKIFEFSKFSKSQEQN
jgi:hypothetical protein